MYIVCLLLAFADVVASGQSSDEVFLRRACLTVTGALPTPAECARFLDSDKPDKRKALIDKLFRSELGIRYIRCVGEIYCV